MRRNRIFIGVLVAATLAACQKPPDEITLGSGEQGEVEISLTSEARTTIITRADESDSDTPDVEDFVIEIFNADGDTRLYGDTYANIQGKVIYLDTGDYKFTAYYGDSLGVGFDAAYWAAEEEFTVEQQVKTSVSATAKMSNVKVAVVYGDNIESDYSDYYTIVRARESSDYEVTFDKDETRAAYVPTGSITLEVYALLDDEEETWGYYTYDAGDFEANDYVTFTIDTYKGTGYLVINVSIDKTTETIEEEAEVPYTYLPKDNPKITFTGFDSDKSAEIIEAYQMPDTLKVDIVAYGEISQCILAFSSTYLNGLGLTSTIDLASVSDETAQLLNEVGITWMSSISGASLAYVNFIGLVKRLYDEAYDSSNPFIMTFSLTVTDKLGQTTVSDIYTISNAAPGFTFTTIDETDVWAKRIYNQTITYTNANSDVLQLQYKAAGEGEWSDATLSSDDGATLTYETITGLSDNTEYTLRAIYNGKEASAKEQTVTTEEALQLGNSSLDEWNTQTFTFSKKLGISYGSDTRDWWLPWAEGDEDNAWWAVNSKVSMPSSTTPQCLYYKVFPCVGYSTEYSDNAGSGYSAHLITTNVGYLNTSSTALGDDYIGELFIGTADDDGEHETDGHSFASRPTYVSFDYQYYDKDSAGFPVEFELKASDGTVPASFEATLYDTGYTWVNYTATLDYSTLKAKAGEIYMSFKASTATDPTITTGVGREFAGETYTIHAGSDLRIDNIQLIYE